MIKYTSFSRRLTSLVLICGLVATTAQAVVPNPYRLPVSFSILVSPTPAGSALMFVHGGAQGGGATGNVGGSSASIPVESGLETAWLLPNVEYTIQIQWSGNCNFEISTIAPQGYEVLIDDEPKDMFTFNSPGGEGTDTIHVIKIRSVEDISRASAGSFSGIQIGEAISWNIGLGGMRNGGSAGRINYRNNNLSSSPANRNKLRYDKPFDTTQIDVLKNGSGVIDQIKTPQVFVDITDDGSGGHWQKFYDIDNVTGSTGGPYTISGSPWRTLHVESSAANKLKVTMVEGSTTEVSDLQLTSGTWTSGAYIWRLQQGDTSTWLRTTTHTSALVSGKREVTIATRTGGTTGTVVSETKQVFDTPYTTPYDTIEELVEVIGDPSGSNPQTTTFAYHTDAAERGNFRRIKSVTEPSGNWRAFWYHGAWNPRGQLEYEYHPYVSSPAAAPSLANQSAANAALTSGRTVKYGWDPDWTNRDRLLQLREEKINNVSTAKTTTLPNESTSASLDRVSFTVNSYRSSTESQESYTERVSGEEYEFEQRGKPRKRRTADGNVTVSSWSLGAYTEPTPFTPPAARPAYSPSTQSFTIGSGWTHSRTVSAHGQVSSTGATSIATWDGQSFDSVNMVANRSTLEAVVISPSGLPLLSELYIFAGGSSFELISWTEHTYDEKGRLTNTRSQNGAETDYAYAHGRLDSMIAPDGSQTSYGYDKLGRAVTVTKNGVTGLSAELTSGYSYQSQSNIVTTNTYDGAHRVRQQVVSSGGPSLTTTTNYDKAGRMTNTTVPGSFTTSMAYSSNHRTVTATLPGGATKITDTYLDGQLKSITGTAVVSQHHGYFLGGGGVRARQTYSGGVGSNSYNTSWDWLGRKIEEWRPGWTGSGWMVSKWHYNDSGQLWKSEATGVADTLYEYDTLGYMWRSGLDVDGGGLATASMDRITETSSEFEKDTGTWWSVQETHAYLGDSSATKTLMGTASTKLTNLAVGRLSETHSTDIFGNISKSYTEVEPANFLTISTTETALTSDSHVVSVAYNGRAVESRDSTGIIIRSEYDALGRPIKVIHPRTGTAETAYQTGSSLIAWSKDTAGTTQATYAYDTAGRTSSVYDPFGKYVRYAYNNRGQVTHTWGEATYPVAYTYNSIGQKIQMHTYRGGSGWNGTSWPGTAGDPDTTTWTYDASTGLNNQKIDDAGRIITYTYTGSGQLNVRTWARGVTTDYDYDTNTGELTSANYSDSTPDITNDYNRRGLLDTVTDFTGQRTFDYCDCGKVTGEQLGTHHSSRHLSYQLDTTTTGAKGRTLGYTLKPSSGSGTILHQLTYDFDASGRLDEITTAGAMGAHTFDYGYLANSNLVTTLDVRSGSTADPFQFARTWENNRNLVATTTTKWSATTAAKYEYTYDAKNRRGTAIQSGTAFADYLVNTHRRYGYNDRSELTSDISYANGIITGTPTSDMSGRRFEFGYDNLGNRTSSNRTGVTALADTYTTNSLNQYTARENNTLAVAGTVANSSINVSVTPVNGGAAQPAGRASGFWGAEVTPNNASGPVQQTVNVTAAGPGQGSGGADLVSTDSENAPVAPASQDYTYDLDGNVLTDEMWAYTWDAENRLTSMIRSTAAVAGSIANEKLEFAYDYLHRRVQKKTSTWSGSAWTLATHRKFLYAGWNVIREDEVLTSKVKTLAWGLDIVGSLSSSAGVGGLIMLHDTATSEAYLPGYDGNGNVAVMIDAATGNLKATYEYSPYGQYLRKEGTYAEANPIRFSTKYTDDETNLVYYGRRYYDPKDGRFVGRDPIGEMGGMNLYAFVSNNTVNSWDYLGMSDPINIATILDPDNSDNSVSIRTRRNEPTKIRFNGGVWLDYTQTDGGGGSTAAQGFGLSEFGFSGFGFSGFDIPGLGIFGLGGGDFDSNMFSRMLQTFGLSNLGINIGSSADGPLPSLPDWHAGILINVIGSILGNAEANEAANVEIRSEINQAIADGIIRLPTEAEMRLIKLIIEATVRSKAGIARIQGRTLPGRRIYINTGLPTESNGAESTVWGRTYPRTDGLGDHIFLNPANFDLEGEMLNGVRIALAETIWHENYHLIYPGKSESEIREITAKLIKQIIEKDG